MLDIMVDLETTGTCPDRHAIIQLAAVRFDLETGDVDPDIFNQCLEIPPWRSWDEDTRTWWAQRPDILNRIFNQMRPAADVMEAFGKWAGYAPWRMWAKPATFEYPYIASYCRDFKVHNPFHYRNVIDVRSYLKGIWFPQQPIDEKAIPFDGDAHDAIFDVLHQIKWVLHNQQARFGSDRDPVSGERDGSVGLVPA